MADSTCEALSERPSLLQGCKGRPHTSRLVYERNGGANGPEFREEDKKTFEASALHPSVFRIARILSGLGLKVFIIGARSIIIHGVDLGRETRDWVIIDKPFTPELRDAITRALRSNGFRVQWRKWGFLVEDDVQIDINYAPLTFDSEFERGSVKIGVTYCFHR